MRVGVFILALAVLGTATLPASGAAANWFGLAIGSSMPEGPFKDDARQGIGGEAAFEHMFNDAVGVGARIAVADWRGTNLIGGIANSYFGPGSEPIITTWSYTAYGVGRMPLQGRVSPYVRAGGGIYNPKLQLNVPGMASGETNHEWGAMAGGGLDVLATPSLRVGMDATWQEFHNAFTLEKNSWVDVRLRVVALLPDWSGGLRP